MGSMPPLGGANEIKRRDLKNLADQRAPFALLEVKKVRPDRRTTPIHA